MKWKPREDEEYYCLSGALEIFLITNDGYNDDKKLIRIGNCFRTKAEAITMANKIKKLLKEG